MYTQPQYRDHHDTQNQGSPFPQGPASGVQNENISMNAMLNQFAGVNLDGGNMASACVTMTNFPSVPTLNSTLPLTASSSVRPAYILPSLWLLTNSPAALTMPTLHPCHTLRNLPVLIIFLATIA